MQTLHKCAFARNIRGRRSELRGAPAPLKSPTRATLEVRTTSEFFKKEAYDL
nr:MAG TPA: hypothetical protein [Bacteriophage sp.]